MFSFWNLQSFKKGISAIMNEIFQLLENPVCEHELEVVSIYQPETQ